jgi:hypothetical protein
MPEKPKKVLFDTGRMVATAGATGAFAAAGEQAGSYILRHVTGDWGDLCDDDKELNDDALRDGDRLLSAYRLGTGVKVWIITEGDRSVTTILLPSEN